MIEFGHGTHRGLRREINEDTYYADPGSGLFLVADGMGGRGHGDRAAAAVRDCIVAETDRGRSLQHAVQEASRCVASARPRTHTAPVGATVAVLRLLDNGFHMACVGDSRIYLWHATDWYGLSHRPELLTPLIDQGLVAIPPADDGGPRTTPGPRRRRSSLTQALGVTPPAELDIRTLRGHPVPGMRFLICSDGLSEQLSDASMHALIARSELGAQECVDHLIRMALDAGGLDNLSAVLVRIS